MAIDFFPSNPNVSAAVQAKYRSDAEVQAAQIRAAQAAAEAQTAQQNAQAQRFWQSGENQRANQLQQQQLANQDFFNRGRLTNEGKSLDAQIAQGQVALTEAEKDRQLKRELGLVAHPAVDWRDQQLMAQQNEIVDAANNHAAALNQKDQLEAAKTQIGKAATAESKRTFLNAPATANYWLGGDSLRKSNVVSNLPNQIGITRFSPDASADPAANIKAASDQLAAQDGTLSKIISAGSAAGLDSHVTRGPDGKWMATIKPLTIGSPAGANGFFRSPITTTNSPALTAPPTATATNAPAAGFFNRNVPSPQVDYPTAVKLLQDSARAGRISRDDYARMRGALDLQYGSAQ